MDKVVFPVSVFQLSVSVLLWTIPEVGVEYILPKAPDSFQIFIKFPSKWEIPLDNLPRIFSGFAFLSTNIVSDSSF